jgi:hypothetical protein
MRLPLSAVPVLVLATLLAACGSEQRRRSVTPRDREAIRVAMRRSPAAFLHYRQRAWWGQTVSIEVRSLRLSQLDSNFAGAVVTVERRRGTDLHQIVLLERTQQRWRVVATSLTAEWIQCKLAPDGVAFELFGTCGAMPFSSEFVIKGPKNSRAASPGEKSAIIAMLKRKLHPAHLGRRIEYYIQVSLIDERFALTRFGGYAPFGGDVLLRHSEAGWQILAKASSGYECRLAPAGVVRSLEGLCFIEGDPSR